MTKEALRCETATSLISASGSIVLHNEEVIFDSNGGAERDINNRVKLAWMKWKQLTGVLCDKKVPIKLKDMVYKTIIKPTMAYGAECWAVRKKDENRLHLAEMRMLRWVRQERTRAETR